MQRRQRLDHIHQHEAFGTVERILLALTESGHQAVLAGGSVRDALLGLTPKDLDVATSATPEVVESLFPATLAVGKAFGTIVVIENGFQFEVTTFRSEGEYEDGRRPKSVAFTDMEQDAARRDFTVNALFYDPVDFVIYDFVGGLQDLRDRRLRTVGLAQERFEEDHLRMLRAARFVAQTGFVLDEQVQETISQIHGLIGKVSAERVLNEMRRLLTSPYLRSGLQVLLTTRLAEIVWPEALGFEVDKLKSFLTFMSWENAFAAICLLQRADSDPRLKAWKASRESQRKVHEQMEQAEILVRESSSRAERIMALGSRNFAETLVLVSGLLNLKGERRKLEDWIAEYLKVAGPDGELPKPYLTGEDLKTQGVPQGESMGKILKQLYLEQLEGRVSSREMALKRVVDLVKSFS